MAKKKTTTTTKPKYDPRTALGQYIEASGDNLTYLPVAGTWENLRQREAFARRQKQKEYEEEHKDEIAAAALAEELKGKVNEAQQWFQGQLKIPSVQSSQKTTTADEVAGTNTNTPVIPDELKKLNPKQLVSNPKAAAKTAPQKAKSIDEILYGLRGATQNLAKSSGSVGNIGIGSKTTAPAGVNVGAAARRIDKTYDSRPNVSVADILLGNAAKSSRQQNVTGAVTQPAGVNRMAAAAPLGTQKQRSTAYEDYLKQKTEIEDEILGTSFGYADKETRKNARDILNGIVDDATKRIDAFMQTDEGRKAQEDAQKKYDDWARNTAAGKLYTAWQETKNNPTYEAQQRMVNVINDTKDEMGWYLDATVDILTSMDQRLQGIEPPSTDAAPAELRRRQWQAQQKLGEIDAADQKWSSVDAYENGVKPGMDAKYYGVTEANKAKTEQDRQGVNRAVLTGYTLDSNENLVINAHDVYRYANEGLAKDKFNIPVAYMTPEMINDFNVYYNEAVKEEQAGNQQAADHYYACAWEYYQGLCEVYLNGCVANQKETLSKKYAQQPGGIIYSLGTVLADNTVNVAGKMAGTIGGMMGIKQFQNPDNPVWQGKRVTDVAQQEAITQIADSFEKTFGKDATFLGKSLRDWGEQAGRVMFSMAQNVTAMAMGGGSGAVTQAIMSFSAACDTFLDAMEQGIPYEKAAILSIGDGIFEWFTEKASLDALLKPDVKDITGSMLKAGKFLAINYGVEASEEGASYLLNTILDKIVSAYRKDKDQIERDVEARTNELLDSMDLTGMSWEEAKLRAGKQARAEVEKKWKDDLLQQMEDGGFSGLGFSLGRTASARVSQVATGRNVNRSDNTLEEFHKKQSQAFKSKAESTDSARANTQYLVDIGKSLNDPQTNAIANKIAAKLEKGKSASSKEIGKLVQNIAMNSSEEIRKDTISTAEEIVEFQLRKGGVEGKDASKLSKIAVKAALNGVDSLNKTERNALKESGPAFDVYQAMVEPEALPQTPAAQRAKQTAVVVRMGVGLATGERTQQLRNVSKIAGGENIQELIGADHIHVADDEVQTATEQQIAAATDDVNFAKDAMNAVVNNEAGRIIGFQNGKLNVQIGGQKVAADLADIRSVDKNVARLVAYMRVHPGIMSDKVANAALDTLGTLGEAAGGTFTNDVAKINFAARTFGKMPMHSIATEAAQVIWDAAKQDAQEAEEKRIRNMPKLNPGNGKTTYEGAEYGSQEWNEKIKSLNSAQRNEMDMVATLTKYLGINTNFIYDDSEAGKQMNGRYLDGAVTINLAARQRNVITGEEGQSSIVPMAHELLHFMEQNSVEEYAKIRDIALNELKGNGVDIESRALMLMDRYNNYYKEQERLRAEKENREFDESKARKMTIDEAIYEMVADSCDQMLTSEEFANRLREQDPDLHKSIRDFVKGWVSKIRRAIENIRGQASYYGQNVRLRTVDEIAKVWLGGYDNIIHRFVNGEQLPVVQESQQETTQENAAPAEEHVVGPYGSFVETNDSGDMLTNGRNQYRNEFLEKGSYKLTDEDRENSNDLRYKLADEDVRNYLKRWANWRLVENQEARAKLLRKYGVSEEDYLNLKESRNQISKADLKKLQILDNDIAKYEQKKLDALGLDESDLGAQYITAWKNNDREKMEQLLMDKIAGNDSIIPYKAPRWYEGKHAEVARLIKDKNPEALWIAAIEMSQLVPKNAVLIPMPPHTGTVTEDTDTYALAQKISQLTGRPVINALASDEHISRRKAKLDNIKMTAEEMGFRQVMDIPDGTIPYFIDNVVGGGLTAKAAHDAFGSGITLAYAKSTKGTLTGVKDASPTYKDPIHQWLIPLDERMDVGNKSVKYSLADLDRRYMDAYNSYDDEEGEKIIAEAAELAFPNSKARDENGKLKVVYHQTNADPFTVFDMEKARQTEDIVGAFFAPEFDKYHEYGDRTYPVYLNIENPAYDQYDMDISQEGAGLKRRNELIAKGYDGVINTENGKVTEYIAFYPEQIKSAEPFTEDDDGDLIHLIQRFDPSQKDIRYSLAEDDRDVNYDVKQGDAPQNIDNDAGEPMVTLLPGNTVASTEFSLSSYRDLNGRKKMMAALEKAGYSKTQITNWIENLDNVADKIAMNRALYDYIPDRDQKFLKENGDFYLKTLDASTMCKRTRLYNGTFNLVQSMLPNTTLMPEDLVQLYNMMKEDNLETPCGFCYVQSRRRLLGQYTEQWLKSYKGEYKPTVEEVNSSEKIKVLRKEHPQTYKDFVKAMNKIGINNPKLVQERTDYRGEILRMKDSTIKYLNDIGGLRVHSFSDFETVHMLDMMQAVMDMAAKGLKSQAFTKIPEFALVFGPTGMKINLSLTGKGVGVDHHGNLVIDDNEGMHEADAMRLRDMYPENVGTIIVGINDDHIIACMGDDRIDFIIPFHKSGWNEAELKGIKTLRGYEDYTDAQNEYQILTWDESGKPKDVEKKEHAVSIEDYWEYDKDGEYNARKYLELCAKRRLVPKFSMFLVDNGNGTWSMPDDDSERSKKIRKGYYKTLIDYRMYNNNGKGAKQQPIQPNFNMKAAMDILENYDGSHRDLPKSEPAAQKFVDWYKQNHPLDELKTEYSLISDEPRTNIQEWMRTVSESMLKTEAERALLRDYKSQRMAIELDHVRIRDIKEKIAGLEKEENRNKHQQYVLDGLKIRLKNAQTTLETHEKKLEQITSSEGYAGLMFYQQQLMNSFVTGKTQDEVNDAVSNMQAAADRIQQTIETTANELRDLANSEGVRRIRSMIGKQTLDEAVSRIRKTYNSTIDRTELANALTKIRLMIQAAAPAEDIHAEIENVAGQILEYRKSSERNATLDFLKGVTIHLGESALKEIYGSNSNLKEIRSMLAGSGVKIAKAEKGQGSLDGDWDELVTFAPALEGYDGIDTSNSMNQAKAVARFVKNAMDTQRKAGAQEFAGQMDGMISDLAGELSQIDMNMPTDKAALERIRELEKYVSEMVGTTSAASQKIRNLEEQAKEVVAGGRKTAMWSRNLKADIAQAIDYFDKTAKLAIDSAKKRKQDAVITQLKNEFAQKMAKSNEQWREMLERDKKARNQAEDNMSARKNISAMLNRLNKLLSAPTNQDNVPEKVNHIARELLSRFVNADTGDMHNKITTIAKKDLAEMSRRLTAWADRDGTYNPDEETGNFVDDNIREIVNTNLDIIAETIKEWNGKYNGKNKLDTLQQMGVTLTRMDNAVEEIYNIIKRTQQVVLGNRRMATEDMANYVRYQTRGKKAKERTGKIGRAIAGIHKGLVSGNMTPEYFFRTMDNDGMTQLWEDYHRAENRNGIELRKSQQFMEETAKEHGYDGWDMNQRFRIRLEKGGEVNLTLGQLMSLYATYKRETTLGPEMSNHLGYGGFYAEEQDLKKGILGKTTFNKKAHKFTDMDFGTISGILTDAQKHFVDQIVRYMSNDMSKLGNEASMKAYGIKMYKEKYYYPFKMWDGIKSRKSNDSGSAASRDRAFHPSFSKTRMHGANNALVIGDFMETVTDHIVGMINYATMGLANDNMQKVLNQTVQEYESQDEFTRRNIRTIMEEAYGMEAMQYLRNLQDQLNGGAVATQKSLGDRAISLFRKNAVAGSLSVALQQPLSYIRAAMMISPKYLTEGLAKEYWKGSYDEMLKHSGVAVIKDMGRFDMGFGQSARDYLTPDGKQSKGRKLWETITDTATILPEKMDAWTWTRMWVAVKQEQHDQHPEMDMKSDEFLDMCGERFNDIMRRTQVYDSVLVKSKNMRSDNFWIKSLTSFMAEPTLSLNVLADAVRMAKNGEKGGKAMMAKAGATFILSAVMQAVFKGLMGAGRNPDDKKTFEENFLYRFWGNLINEINPANLVPGYNDAVTLLKEGKLQDDAMGAVGKIVTASRTGIDLILGNSKKGTYRDIEDSVGQIVQLFTNLPAKNLMRDARAMFNFFTQPYAQRDTSSAVLKYQSIDELAEADNLLGVVNKYLGDAGYKTNTVAYTGRIYNQLKEGNDQAAQDMEEYLSLAKGVKEENIFSGIVSAAKKDTSLSSEQKARILTKEGGSYDSNWWKMDRAEFERNTGEDIGGSSTYYRLWDAMDNNSAAEIKEAVKTMTDHGVKTTAIKSQITEKYKKAYLAADNDGKRKIRDAIQKAYKAIGLTAEDADKIINKWK